jgi:hypothetical protein
LSVCLSSWCDAKCDADDLTQRYILGFNRSFVKPEKKNCGHFYKAYCAAEYLIGLNLCLPKNKSAPWSRQFSEASVFPLVKKCLPFEDPEGLLPYSQHIFWYRLIFFSNKVFLNV